MSEKKIRKNISDYQRKERAKKIYKTEGSCDINIKLTTIVFFFHRLFLISPSPQQTNN